MADLQMSEEEKRLPFMQWDNAELGKVCKALAAVFHDDNGQKGASCTGAAIFLIAESIEHNSTETTITIRDASIGSEKFGDWEITLKRLDSDSLSQEE